MWERLGQQTCLCLREGAGASGPARCPVAAEDKARNRHGRGTLRLFTSFSTDYCATAAPEAAERVPAKPSRRQGASRGLHALHLSDIRPPKPVGSTAGRPAGRAAAASSGGGGGRQWVPLDIMPCSWQRSSALHWR